MGLQLRTHEPSSENSLNFARKIS